MSIGSIDVATMMPRTVNAAEAQGKEITQNQHIGDQNAIQFQRETVQQSQQTVETQESETKDYDGGGNGSGASNGQGKKKKKDGQQGQKMAPRSNSSFDIMV